MCPPSSPSAEIIVIERPAGDFSLPFEALDLKVLVIKYRDPQHFTLVHAFSIISLLLEPYTSPTNFYKELPNSDFPSLHDYDCSNSRLFDACQLAVYDVTEAKYKCDLDDRCKAFVTTARTLWTGYIIVYLKNDTSHVEPNKGTTVYIKQPIHVTSNTVALH